MIIKKYSLELAENSRHPSMVAEASFEYCGSPALNSPEDITNMLNECFRLKNQAEEHVYMVALDSRAKPLGVFEVSHGTVSCSVLNPREVFIRSLICGAVNIVLAHNHPSGEPIPSDEDIDACNRIREAGALIGITLQDFLVIGETYYSFLENGLL